MSESLEKQPPRKKRRWLLLASLALNLFLIAFLVVGTFRHHSHGDRLPRPIIGLAKFVQADERAEWFLRFMPDEDEPALRALRMNHGDPLRIAAQENRAARSAVLALISDGERDPAVLGPAFNRLTEARTALQAAHSALLLQASQTLSDEGYEHLAGWRKHKYRDD